MAIPGFNDRGWLPEGIHDCTGNAWIHPGIHAQLAALLMVAFCCGPTTVSGATPDVFRSWFTPTVVPTNFVGSVRFEAEITGNPSSVVFNYNGTNRPMSDSGGNVDQVPGDGIWTCSFTASEIISKNTSNRVFRPFIGTCNPTNAGAFNTFAEVWTSEIGLVPIRTNLAAGAQLTDYIVNFAATRAQLTNFNPAFWASNFYRLNGDKFDFLNFVHVAGVRGNRYHAGVKNAVGGTGLGIFDNTASFGSAGRLQGYTVFPISSFYDGASPTFSHETGHQWMNFLSGTPYADATPHWPLGDIAINVMGFSIPGSGAGGTFPYTFTTNGAGGYTVGPDIATNHSTFNPMELYLMGFATTNEVPTYFILTNQNATLTNGQALTPGEFTLVTISNIVAAKGPRVPDTTSSQRIFRCATIVLSEHLLNPQAMSLYDYFTRRIEARAPVSYADGLATGTGNPWLLATGARAMMYSRITDEAPALGITRLTNSNLRFDFTARPGIRYQPQRSFALLNWSNDGPAFSVAVANPANVETNFVRAPLPGTNQTFYRLNVVY